MSCLNSYSSISVKYERIKFLVIALKNAVEIYAWAPKPYHKFMAFKVSTNVACLIQLPSEFYFPHKPESVLLHREKLILKTILEFMISKDLNIQNTIQFVLLRPVIVLPYRRSMNY